MRGERARAHRRRSDCFVKVARAPTGGNHAQFGGLESVGASQSRWRHACRGRWPRTRELTAPTQRAKRKKKVIDRSESEETNFCSGFLVLESF